MLTKIRLFLSPWWMRCFVGTGIGLVAWVMLIMLVADATLCPPPPLLVPIAEVAPPLPVPEVKPKKKKGRIASTTPPPVYQAVPPPVAPPLDPYSTIPRPSATAVRGVLGVVVGGVSLILLTFFANSEERRRQREVQAAALALAHARKHNERIDHYLAHPLADHTLCTACGWLGRFRSNAPTYSGTKTVGSVAAAGGGGIAILGIGGSGLGIVLILIGLPLLLFFCIGVIPIVIGVILLFVGGTATVAGTSVAAAGATAAHGANRAATQAAAAPNQCPQCKNVGLIPALSPMGVHHITNTPTVSAAAEIEARKVIANLPNVIDIQPLPELNG